MASGKQAKLFEFTLTDDEAMLIHWPRGTGGRQSLERRLYSQLRKSPNKVTLTDGGLGMLLRYMSQYDGSKPVGEGGGLQARLHKAFARSLREKFKL